MHNVMITLNGLNNALHALLSSCLQQGHRAATWQSLVHNEGLKYSSAKIYLLPFTVEISYL